jgi:hypothetical protein
VTSFEEDTLVFIIRFWIEPRKIRGASLVWRGAIEHVSSGQRRYFRDLEGLLRILKPYLYEYVLRQQDDQT